MILVQDRQRSTARCIVKAGHIYDLADAQEAGAVGMSPTPGALGLEVIE
jgi:hypothetical protein